MIFLGPTILILTIWVAIDAYKRKNNVFLWPLGTFFLTPIIAPLYFTKRNLKDGEAREGGAIWNFTKNFAFVWTALIAGATLGTGYSLLLTPMLSFFPWMLVLMLSFFKKSTKEKGPTGKLADSKFEKN